MTRRHARNLAVVYLAAIVGWFWRIGLERWPTWQPVFFLGGVTILGALTAWLTRAEAARLAAESTEEA